MLKYCSLVLTALLFVIVASSQTISTIAGTGKPGYAGDGGTATLAQMNTPSGLVADRYGNVYFADPYNNAIRKISASGIMSTVAGDGTAGYSGDGGPASRSRLSAPVGMAIDQHGNIYFSDQNNAAIRKISFDGIITTIAGNGHDGYTGDGGRATDATMYIPSGIAVDNNGDVYFADSFNHVIRKISARGIITTVAGNGKEGYSGDGGPAISAKFRFPVGVEVDGKGNIIIADTHNNVIRKVAINGIVTTIAGKGIEGYAGDGRAATDALLRRPVFIKFDTHGNLLIPDAFNHVIRMIDPSGTIATIAGNGQQGYSGDGGNPLNASFNSAAAVAINSSGHIYISDGYNYVIRKVIPCTPVTAGMLKVTPSRIDICAGETINFSAMPSDPNLHGTYQWVQNGNPLAANGNLLELSNLVDGDEVHAVFIPDLPCTAPLVSDIISIHVNPSPLIRLADQVTIQPGESIRLTPDISGVVSRYNWSPAAGLDNTQSQNPLASPSKETIYQLQAVSDKGCVATAAIRVNIYKQLLMPGAFSPDHNGKNDVFRIPPGSSFELQEFSIYNRWGQRIFKTTDIRQGWDGSRNGVLLDAGFYLYHITGSDSQGKKSYKGTFMLVR